MVLWYLLIFIVSFVSVNVKIKGFYEDYLVKERCDAIKGVFILLVFLGHVMMVVKNSGYGFNNVLDQEALKVFADMGQLVVAMFLFYSGYGVMRSFRIKGDEYLASYPKRRLLTVLVNFDIAVCCFIALTWVMGGTISIPKVLLSFIGWESFGNSNWYIFVIMYCYLVFFLVFKAARTRYLAGSLGVVVMVFIGMIILHGVKESPIWYNTMLVFPSGVLYELYSNKLEQTIQKRYWLVLAIVLSAFLFLHLGNLRSFHGITENVKAVIFAMLVVILTMKVRVGNKWLLWCGVSLFPLYVYQRFPMRAIQWIAGDEWLCYNPNAFIATSFILTVGISILYNKYFRIKLT